MPDNNLRIFIKSVRDDFTEDLHDKRQPIQLGFDGDEPRLNWSQHEQAGVYNQGQIDVGGGRLSKHEQAWGEFCLNCTNRIDFC